jgi:hypothetical protein
VSLLTNSEADKSVKWIHNIFSNFNIEVSFSCMFAINGWVRNSALNLNICYIQCVCFASNYLVEE